MPPLLTLSTPKKYRDKISNPDAQLLPELKNMAWMQHEGQLVLVTLAVEVRPGFEVRLQPQPKQFVGVIWEACGNIVG